MGLQKGAGQMAVEGFYLKEEKRDGKN